MTEKHDSDQLLEDLQTLIDSIRTCEPDMEEQCLAWQKRLYEWHDFLLEMSAERRTSDPDATSHLLEGDDAKRFLDGFNLKDELLSHVKRFLKDLDS